MEKTITYKNRVFILGGYTPRNEYEKGNKYKLFMIDNTGAKYPTSYIFATIKEAKNFIKDNYFIF